MVNVACRYERDARDVEEIVADAVELAHRHLAMLLDGTEAQVRSWLLRTVRLLAINHVRRSLARNRAFARLVREPLSLVPSAEDEFMVLEEAEEAAVRSRQITEVLLTLDIGWRTALAMDADGSTGPEIGVALGTSAGGARKRLQRAREGFRASWVDGPPVSKSRGGRPDA